MNVNRVVAVVAVLFAVVATAMAQPGSSVFTPSANPKNPTPDTVCLDSANLDTCLVRDAANTLAQRNGTNGQSFQIYNTFTSTSNFERGFVRWSANTLQIGNETTGGSNRDVNFYRAGSLMMSLPGTQLRINGAGGLDFGSDNAADIGASGANRPRNVFVGTVVNSPTYATATNCSSSGSPATCAAAAAGSAVIAAAATSVVVNTTAVTANSQILITEDQSLGTKLSVTCNTQSDLTVGTPEVSARSAGTSFTVIVPVAPTANPLCFSYLIVN